MLVPMLSVGRRCDSMGVKFRHQARYGRIQYSLEPWDDVQKVEYGTGPVRVSGAYWVVEWLKGECATVKRDKRAGMGCFSLSSRILD